MNIVIIDYGAGNIRSVQFALERFGLTASCTSDADDIRRADKVIFPGVGTADRVMKELRKKELDRIIPQLKQPVLGICVGMQVMCNHSQDGHTDGLGIFPINVLRFSEKEKVPHMGWNTIQNLQSGLLQKIEAGSFVYYVHSYYAPVSEYTIAITHYQTEFSAMLKKENFYACQFHPEKSGRTGHQILQNFLFEIN